MLAVFPLAIQAQTRSSNDRSFVHLYDGQYKNTWVFHGVEVVFFDRTNSYHPNHILNSGGIRVFAYNVNKIREEIVKQYKVPDSTVRFGIFASAGLAGDTICKNCDTTSCDSIRPIDQFLMPSNPTFPAVDIFPSCLVNYFNDEFWITVYDSIEQNSIVKLVVAESNNYVFDTTFTYTGQDLKLVPTSKMLKNGPYIIQLISSDGGVYFTGYLVRKKKVIVDEFYMFH